MRSKEEAHDYRYFPDPDLLPLEFDAAYVDGLKKHLPELPDEKKARFMREFRLSRLTMLASWSPSVRPRIISKPLPRAATQKRPPTG